MDAVLPHVVPPFGGEEVRERVGMLMRGDLGISRRPGGEVHQHDLVPHGRAAVRGTLVHLGIPLALGVVEVPPFPLAHGGHLDGDLRALFRGTLRLFDDGARGGADDCFHARCVETVHEIFLFELVGRGDANGAQLVKSDDDRPKFPMSAQHQEDSVPLANAEGFEIVCRLCRLAHHLAKSEDPLLSLG